MNRHLHERTDSAAACAGLVARGGGENRPAADSVRRAWNRPRAFTLLEVLVAAALMGMLLLAMNFFVFSMAEIWGRGAERRLFDQHVRAVTREVQTLVRNAALPPVSADPPVFAREIRTDDGRRLTPVSFELPAGSPRLPWEETPLPDVVCSLVLQDGKGLVLYWQSRLERDFADGAPRAFVLSAFGSGMSYDYLESNGTSWRNYDQLQRAADGKWRIPERLRLTFTHGQMKTETTVAMPTSTVPLPHF